MGEHSVNATIDQKKRAEFIRHLLNDIKSLEIMYDLKLIESDVQRIGAEQEFCLINKQWRPSNQSEEILKSINDDHFTTELARYNLEINLDPLKLEGNCFSHMEQELSKLLNKAKSHASKFESDILLTGILPTISKNELEIDYMSPNPRYLALNNTMRNLRKSDFTLYLKGVDELSINHDSVLFEACNTSFQLHLQIDPEDFVSSYNWAQAIAGPVLSICTNSPLLLGRELWAETRIALFQQSIETRSSSYALKDQISRVSFGTQWARGSLVDIFKENIAQHKTILTRDIEEDSLQLLEQGEIPKLKALSLHNGTTYTWNRPCYGVGNGKPHVRIENRYIPAGPTVIDEMANFTFWVGLMRGRSSEFDNMPAFMDFRDAKANFIKAARLGKEALLHWQGKDLTAKKLIKNELLPIAYTGLERSGILKEDIEKYLGIIEQRLKNNTGSQWLIKNYRKLRQSVKQDDALIALTKASYENQNSDKPVHEWPMLKEAPKIHESAYLVKHIMSTKLFIVDQDDLADLATNIMRWKNIHHMPVENHEGELCGLITWTHMKRRENIESIDPECTVADIMTKDVITAIPTTPITEAIRTMKHYEIGCMPVVDGRELVGIITIKDVIPFDHD